MLTRDATKPVCVYLPKGGAAPSIFVHAFSSNTWLVLVIFLALITLAIAVTVHVETRVILDHPGDDDDDDDGEVDDEEDSARSSSRSGSKVSSSTPTAAETAETEHWDGSEILLVTAGAVCQQGCPRDPDTLSARLVFLTLFMMAVLCHVAFSAAVTSLVSSERSSGALTLDQLLRRQRVDVLLQDSAYFRRTLRSGSRGARLRPLRRGLGALLSGGETVLCADIGDLQLQLRQLGRPGLWCELQVTAFTLPLAPEPLSLQQGNASSSWRDELRRLEAGLWTRARRARVLPDVKTLCAEATRGAVIPVSLRDVWLAPALLAAGAGASLLLLALEGARSWGGRRVHDWRASRRPRLPFTL